MVRVFAYVSDELKENHSSSRAVVTTAQELNSKLPIKIQVTTSRSRNTNKRKRKAKRQVILLVIRCQLVKMNQNPRLTIYIR